MMLHLIMHLFVIAAGAVTLNAGSRIAERSKDYVRKTIGYFGMLIGFALIVGSIGGGCARCASERGAGKAVVGPMPYVRDAQPTHVPQDYE